MENNTSSQNNQETTAIASNKALDDHDNPVKPVNRDENGGDPQKKKLVKIGLVIFGVLVLLGVAYLTYAKFAGSKDTGKSETNIFIGDVTITQDDIDRYARSLDSYKSQNPNVVIEGESKQVAVDDLVMNAALKKEAKDKEKSLTDEDYQKTFEIPQNSPGFQEYLETIKDGDTSAYYEVINKENVTLRRKLESDLISERSLFYVSITFDAPFFRSQSDEPAVAKLHEEAKATLNSKFLPLFENKATKEEIAAQADVNYMVYTEGNENPDKFFEKVINTADYIEKYRDTPGENKYLDPQMMQDPNNIPQSFTDLENVDYGTEVEDLRDTVDEINKLENVGDYTGVFASKTGAYMIVRLETKAGGEYVSWDDFLGKYKDEYVAKDEQASASLAKRLSSNVADKVSEATKTVSNLGVQKVQAAVNCNASGHSILVEIEMIDVDTWQRVNGPVSIAQQSGQCPSKYGSASGNGRAAFTGNCYNHQPTWSSTVPSGYTRVGVQADDWTPTNVNQRGNFRVFIHVRRTAQPLDVNGSSRLVKASDGSLIGAQGSGSYSEPHALAINTPNYLENYQSTISRTWSVDRNRTFQVCATAPDWIQGSVRYTRNGARQQCRNVSNGNGANASFTFTYNEPGPPPPPPNTPTCELRANNSLGPITISSGSSFNLSWSTRNSPTSLRIDPGVGTGTSPSGGQATLSPGSSTTYSGRLNGTSTVSCQVTVNVNTPPPPPSPASCSFTAPANPTTIRSGNPVTLTWTSVNASSVGATNIPGGASLPGGTTTITPLGSTVYTITVRNSAGVSGNPCAVSINVASDQPYFKITGNDSQAGSVFDDNNDGVCTTSDATATFKGFNIGTSPYGGSGAQFALLALGTIEGVASANLRTQSSTPSPKRETIANSDLSKPYGGDSGIGRCMPDYFAKHTGTPLGTGHTISSFTALVPNEQRVLFVDGDAYINTDITYEAVAGDKKSFTLIVKGDIYIDNDVGQLDGIYIAQNKADNSAGLIYTCALGLRSLPTASQLPTQCGRKLVTNGALIARLIKPWRTNGSLLNPDTPANVAEEFNFSPELYLEPIKFGGSSSTKTYDSITNTAPVF